MEPLSLNPSWTRPGPTDAHGSDRSWAAIAAFHASLPGFRPTPLIGVPPLAAELGAGTVWVKHECDRIGLPSFKVLGASWGVNCAIAERCGTQVPASFPALAELAAELPPGTRLTTATDGNHGRAVARMARLLNLPCEISVPAGTADARIAAIASEGAALRITDGSYDEAVQRVAGAAADDPGQLLVQDTSWSGYQSIPAAIVAGYGTIFTEIEQQLARRGAPSLDLAFVPAGVGSFAAAAVAYLHVRGCGVVTVEPDDADCVRRSVWAEVPVAVPGPHRSIMAGLNCGEVSQSAWPVLRSGLRAATAVSDAETIAAMRTLDAAGLPSGESGAAALAGARSTATALRAAPTGWGALCPTPSPSMLLLVTEGVTDPERYAELIRANR